MVSLANPKVDSGVAMDGPAPPSPAALAWRDLAEGLAKIWMWPALAVQDVKLRYRGSVLGPFWLTISTLVMVACIGLVYSQLFQMEVRTYLPFLAVGLIVWQFLAGMINEGCETFLRETAVIQQVRIPFSVHAYRTVFRNLIVLGHSLVIVPLGIVVLAIPVDWHLLAVVPALLTLIVNGVWVSILLGMIGARFRDVPPIVASLLQALFFFTPVIWRLDALKKWQIIGTANPLFAAVDVVRSPLIGAHTADSSWPVLLATTAIGCTITLVLFARFRSRIAYWV
jgi:ABC-2 type transport system permease protein/lipopolysaccharide transport system permease protein